MADNIFRLRAGELSAAVEKVKGGIRLYSIRDKKQKKTLLTRAKPLFSLTARAVSSDEKIIVNSAEGWAGSEIVSGKEGMTIVLYGNKSLPNVTVTITAACEQNRISWTTMLTSANKEYALFECDYPAISFDTNSNTVFFSPYGCGEVMPSNAKGYGSVQNYPSYGVSMQYFAFYNTKTRRGIYYGLHDPAPAYKKLSFKKEVHEKVMTLKGILPLTSIDVVQNSQSLAGSVVWEIFDGDWYDAALIYRNWVQKEACWIPEAKNGVRTDIADWFKKNDHWWLVRVKEDDSFVDEILKANEELGVKSAVHLYDWHQIPFDNDYPHYFPIKEATKKGLKRLKEAGVKVMPYINGRLWDTKDKGMEDWQWSKIAKPSCTKDRNGVPFIEKYGAAEADGNKVEHSIMCPSTALWQEKMSQTVSKLVNDLGADAVYMDQIAAATPYMCEDRTHSHLPGGGTWWCESYNNLLEHVNRTLPKETCIATECTSDPVMKHIQGYLTWLWVKGNQVPAFPVIYSGYVAMFGRHYCSLPKDDAIGQKITFAQSLSFGEQMGWVDPLLFESFKYKEFYKTCVRARAEISEYFYDGRMLRPPYLNDDREELMTDKAGQAYGGIIKHSAVFGSIWVHNRDAKRLLLLINAADEEALCTVECDLPDGIYNLSGMENGKLEIKQGKAEISIPALSAVYAEI